MRQETTHIRKKYIVFSLHICIHVHIAGDTTSAVKLENHHARETHAPYHGQLRPPLICTLSYYCTIIENAYTGAAVRLIIHFRPSKQKAAFNV